VERCDQAAARDCPRAAADVRRRQKMIIESSSFGARF
jgi:hypothetical protein